MMKFLIGPVLTGVGYIAGSYYGRDAEQAVHKSPSAAYDDLRDMISSAPSSGTTSFEGGSPIPYALESEETGEHHLHLTLSFAGQEGATADIEVRPGPGDDQSVIAARFHGERKVLESALAGTDKARLAYAPDWILNLASKSLLRQLATGMERGELSALAGSMAGDPRSRWEAGVSPAEREQQAEWQQYQATKPMTDLAKPTSQN
jgi:hypothetical protein